MNELKLTFNGRPPSVNFMYRISRGKIYKRSPSKQFTQDIKTQLDEQLNVIEGFEKYTSNIKLKITFYLKTRRLIDTDNLLKVVCDAFNKTRLYDDDKIISCIEARRYIGCARDKFDIVITNDIEHDNNNEI